MRKPLLDVHQLTTQFHTQAGTLTAVRHVSLSLAEGEVLGLVGESGSGKSALGATLMGLHDPGSTTVCAAAWTLGQTNMATLSERAWQQIRGQRIAMVFQDPMTALNPYLRVGSQLKEVLTTHTNLPPKTIEAQCINMLGQVGLPEPQTMMQSYPHALSGGMRQRVVLAMALLGEPQLLIADEPTTALDVTIQAQILALLREQGIGRSMAMLLITHDLGVLAGIAERIAVMYAGELVEVAPCDALYASPRHPYTAALLAAMPDLPAKAHHTMAPPKPIEGQPPHLTSTPIGCAFAPRCTRVMPQCTVTHPHLAPNAHGTWVRCFNPVPQPAVKP